MKDRRLLSKKTKKMLQYERNLYRSFIISLMVPVLIAMLAFLIYSNYSMEQRERQDMQNILESVSSNIELQLSEAEEIAMSYYMQTSVFKQAECLNNPKLYQYYDELSRSQIEDEYSEIIAKLIHTSSQSVRSVVFFPVNERNAVGYYIGRDSSVLTEVLYPGYTDEEWFTDAVLNPGKMVFYRPHTPFYLKKNGERKVYSCSIAIRDMDTKKVIGVVKIDIDDERLKDSLNILGSHEVQGFVLLQQGQTFMKSDVLPSKDIADNIFYQKEICNVGETNLELLYVYSKLPFYIGYATVIMFVLLLIFVSILLAFKVYRQRMKKNIEDVEHITEIMEQAGRGELDGRIEIDSENEIGKIADIINQMMDNLQDYIGREYLMVIENQKAEYRALQSQINPHFLYNTLNGFVALNRMGEKKLLEKSIVSLSKLFRYTCKGEEIADIQSEFQFLEEYLKLQKLKYEDRLEYMIWMDDVCKNNAIPKLLLQPVVENSIVHGMVNMERPMLIKASAIQQEVEGIGAVMVINIHDNGCGYDIQGKQDENTHIGVKNVQKRAELFCKNVIVQMTSEKGKGTKTTFVFPQEEIR